MRALTAALRGFAGLGIDRTGHLEKWLSVGGGLAGLLGVLLVSEAKLGLHGSAAVVASMGASAVLLFAVPHGPLSQPWPVFGGHLVSAVVGVACATLVSHPFAAASMAVALAIGAMHYLRCIHPPGGATALTAVVGGDAVHALGFEYVLTPVLLNVLVMLCVAVVFNFPFAWRRYPAAWARVRKAASAAGDTAPDSAVYSREALSSAARAIDAVPDFSPHHLDTICHLARCNAEPDSLRAEAIRPGACYCNGEFGSGWQVRQVIDIRPAAPGGEEQLVFRIVAGTHRRRSGSAGRAAFAGWARYEVCLNENSWQRVQQPRYAPVSEDAA